MKKLWLFITGDSHLGARLGLSFGALIVILLSVGGVGIRQLRRAEADFAKTVDQRWKKVQLSRKALAISNLNSRMTMQTFFVDEKEIEALAEQVEQLEAALGHVKQLQGILPICSYCKKIRDDSNYWQNVESYVTDHSHAEFSHGICPTCYETTVKPQLESLLISRSLESTSTIKSS